MGKNAIFHDLVCKYEYIITQKSKLYKIEKYIKKLNIMFIILYT